MENEVRLVFHDDESKYIKEKGIDLDISINELIKEIKVSPSLPQYVYELICQEVKDADVLTLPVMSDI